MTTRLFGAALLCLLAATGCATSTETPDPGLPPAQPAPEVSAEAARHLCDMISPELDTWRDQGHAVARVSFNATVHNWALRSGGINAAVTRNRSVVDDVTSGQCPEVRDQALQVLDVPDLASALAGF